MGFPSAITPRFTDLDVADEPRTLDELRKHFTKVSSLPFLGLEYFHEYLDRYSAKEQMRRGLANYFGSFLNRVRFYAT